MESSTLDMSAQTSGGVAATRPDRLLFLAGVLQIVATFTPAARMRIVGGLSFVRLPNAGVTLVVLGLLTLAIALRPNRWWRFIPSILSAIILVVVYFRLKRNPSHTFVDPLLRHLLHPSWGFWPMGAAVFFSLVAAARVRPRRRTANEDSASVFRPEFSNFASCAQRPYLDAESETRVEASGSRSEA